MLSKTVIVILISFVIGFASGSYYSEDKAGSFQDKQKIEQSVKEIQRELPKTFNEEKEFIK